MFKIQKLLFLLCCVFSSYISADETILQLRMEENSFAPRTGTLNIINPSTGTSPFASDPDFLTVDSGLRLNAQWESICASNVALAGGQLDGWLLGPATEGTLGLEIDNTHNEFRAIFGLGPGNFSTTLYATIAGDFFGTPTDGIAQRFSCSGGTDIAEFAILYIFLWPNATTFADKGFYIGDIFYQTEIGIQHYFLYHSARLL
ncbi:MAG: hypothetical protein K0U40_06405 [Betaproteobacteria bacterium]|nr:hypothetical protein [Betaproteobacteria bacterium]